MKFLLISLLILLQASSLVAQQKLPFPLDPLTEFPKNWEMTPKDFESRFGKGKVKLYEWLTADKSRVKFSRSRFRGLEIDLTLFEETLRVEEAIIDFHKGKLNLITFSIHNRGDSGKTTSEAFNKLHLTCGKAMNSSLKVRPSSLNTLTRFVTKDPKGNVFIKDLPMVDQGSKGYCVGAGHEFKTMKMSDAFKASRGIFSLRPTVR